MNLNKENKYQAYTLLELLVVMGIIAILAGMSFASFGGLQNTVKMNEYSLTLEQDIRSVQRAAMLLQRDPNEKWLYGLGMDLTNMATTEGQYKVFKWCSPYDNYGDIKTTSLFPNYDPSNSLKIGDTVSGEKNAYLPVPQNSSYALTSCDSTLTVSHLRTLLGYESTSLPPESNITVKVGDSTAGYVVFEAVSGKTFFYGVNGELLNYQPDGKLIDSPNALEIIITPVGKTAKAHKLIISNLSGKISTEIVE